MRKGLFRTKAERQMTKNCDKCKLYQSCKTPNMPVNGEGKKGILVISEFPSATDDRKGVQLVDEAGAELAKVMKRHGIRIHEDCWTYNAINCHLPKNKKATSTQWTNCHPNLEQTIKTLKPQHIILLGNVSVSSFYLNRFKYNTATRWRGHCIPDRKYNAWVHPMYSASMLAKAIDKKDTQLPLLYDRDMEAAAKAITSLRNRRPKDEPLELKKKVKLILDINDFKREMRRILRQKPVCNLDYECSGLKPHRRGQAILTASIFNGEYSIAFPVAMPRSKMSEPPFISGKYKKYWTPSQYRIVLKYLKKFCTDPKIKKVIHNAKFEAMWTKVFLGVDLVNVIWCSMVNQHVLDDRELYCGLKLQAYIRWGIEGYEKEMHKYVEDDSNGNDFNKLHKMPLDKLLLYNGIDTYVADKLYKAQYAEFGLNSKPIPDLNICRNLFHTGWQSFGKAELNGIRIDPDYFYEQDWELEDQLRIIEHRIQNSKEGKLYTLRTGKQLNPSSSLAVATLLYKYLKYKPPKNSTKGDSSADKNVLMKINTQFTKDIIEYRKVKQTRNTYLSQWLRESVGDLVHPFMNLHTTRTGRSSANKPNVHNTPKRDEEQSKIIRQGIISRVGRKLAEIDFGSQEVRIAACYTKDPVLVAYINDTSTDMHRDEATHLFKLKSWQVSKKIRFFTKNGWVFPEFYGSYYGNCAKNLWYNIVQEKLRICLKDDSPKKPTGPTVKEHLRKHGIRNLKQFTEHCKKHEKVFWGKFKVFKKWQEAVRKEYRDLGYVTSLLGFRRGGYLKDEVINAPIQGTAFHCLLWAFNRITEIAEKENWNTLILFQVHDSIVLDIDPAEEQHVMETVRRVMEKDIREAFDWLIVPLEAEPEITEIDGTWFEKKKYEYADAA